MSMTDEAMFKLCETMKIQHCAGDSFEVELGELIGKYRAAHDARMRDARAAELLPRGRMVAAELLAVAPSTVYKMVHRHRRSTVEQAA